MSEDYPTLASVDLAVWRAFERLIKYRAADDANSVVIQEAVVNRLLARRSVLMAVRDGRPTPMNTLILPTPDLLRGVLYLAYLAALDARIAQGWDRINERQAS